VNQLCAATIIFPFAAALAARVGAGECPHQLGSIGAFSKSPKSDIAAATLQNHGTHHSDKGTTGFRFIESRAIRLLDYTLKLQQNH